MNDRPDMEAVLREITRRIASRFNPEKLILFGSFARGEQNADSDLDLLVVMRVSGSRRRQAVAIDLALAGIPLPTDVIVVSPEDVEKYRDIPGAVVGEAFREGRVLYERAA